MNLASFAVLLLVPFALARRADLSTVAGGLLLAASPAGVMLGGPLAGRLARRVPASVLMPAGAAAIAAGLGGIAVSGGALMLLAPMMLAQGLGLGVFQVAYFDVVTGAIPARDRGVAGSLGMLTRTLGLVSGATVLMSVFQGVSAGASFGAGFRAAFLVAAALALGVAGVGLARLRRG